jgi:hypothetical protein
MLENIHPFIFGNFNKENLEMNEKEFILWLRGFADGVGNDISNKQWEQVLIKLHEVQNVGKPNAPYLIRERETKEGVR